ncbi:MAG: amino acid ABC transporter substrate-binding protein [Saccharospirillaceae bacterium]|nr:amino acid ABC transporter substrate-binding protein [Pseudomonadales bacterium]NRB79346.1 amino acid ABC transporter substrate-binding protein [Saccharospirillaceae bacterium]
MSHLKTVLFWALIMTLLSCNESNNYQPQQFNDSPKRVELIPGDTLKTVKQRGRLICGVSTGITGFSIPDRTGSWSGFDVDYCKAVATAVFGNPDKVEYMPLSASHRFTALSLGEVDILSRNSTWTLSRETQYNLLFAGITYFDGQGFLIDERLAQTSLSARDLDGAAICMKAGTSSEQVVAEYFRNNDMQYQPVLFSTLDQTKEGFEAGRCSVLTSDQSQLYAIKSTLKKNKNSIILPDIISKEPLGPVVRQDDIIWFNIARWTLNAMIEAEELGLNQDNIQDFKNSNNPNIERFMGEKDELGNQLGLSNQWAYLIIKEVGNYGDIFDRNIGKDSDINIHRGLNNLWNRGGLLYSPPMR